MMLPITEHKRSTPPQFERIKNTYPLDVLKEKTVILIGCGGAADVILSLLRSGVEKVALFDGDYVEASNIATQCYYANQVGKLKTEALSSMIWSINPNAAVKSVPYYLDDSFSDKEFESIIGEANLRHPENVLIIAATDSFSAQDRAAKLAAKYGTCFIAAQMYEGGEGGEIYFHRPGVTMNGCPRCALQSRYDAYKDGFQNHVTSYGCSIFSSEQLNAMMGHIAMMLLLYEEGGENQYTDMLDDVSDTNFVMLDTLPYYERNSVLELFEDEYSSEFSFFGDTLWLYPYSEECGNSDCPMCGGTGDLSHFSGQIPDTRRWLEQWN